MEESPQNSTSPTDVVNLPILQHEWTVSQFIENRRRFNIDLSPKVNLSNMIVIFFFSLASDFLIISLFNLSQTDFFFHD